MLCSGHMPHTDVPAGQPTLSCLEKPLPLDGFRGTPEEIEQQWYDQVYLGSGDRIKQLTWRAVIVGMLLGSILSLTNLYANLKMGWSFGVALTAGIISFALWNAFVRLGISKSPMTILENTCMQSAASSAGYSTGGTLTSAVAALLLLTGQHMPLGVTFAWIFFIAILGVTMAIPMKRQMINIEQIKFPDSIATAETLKVLYSEGKKAAGQAKALLYSALFASANAIAMALGGENGWEPSNSISWETGTREPFSSMGPHVCGGRRTGGHENLPQPFHWGHRLLGSVRSLAFQPGPSCRWSRLPRQRWMDAVGRHRMHGRSQHRGLPLPMESIARSFSSLGAMFSMNKSAI